MLLFKNIKCKKVECMPLLPDNVIIAGNLRKVRINSEFKRLQLNFSGDTQAAV